MKISSAKVTGKNNLGRNRDCQDKIATFVSPYLSAIAIADGASNGENSREGAEVNVITWQEFIEDSMSWDMDYIRLREALIDKINMKLDKMPYEKPHLSATLTAVAVRNDGSVRAISIGDGFLIGFDRNLEPHVLKYPYNVGRSTLTCFTCLPDKAKETGQVLVTTLDGCLTKPAEVLTGFAVFSDGAGYLVSSLLKGGEMLRLLAAHTACGEEDYAENLVKQISEQYSNDDVSIACMMSDQKDVLATARRIIEDAVPAETPEEAPAPAETAPAPPEEPGTPEEETVPDFEKLYPYYRPVVQALYQNPMSYEELEQTGYCLPGKVMDMLLPLIQNRFVELREGKFCLSKEFLSSEL